MKHIHVISFQNPVPPDYGGVIDVYYKLKAFHDEGWNISLHTYCYKGRRHTAPSFFTENDKVYYYERRMGWRHNVSKLPYIVNSRRDASLLNNLLADDSPILFEGLHTTFLLDEPRLGSRLKIVRAHNVEHDYYAGLAASEKSFARKLYFYMESLRLRKYENVLCHADVIAAISSGDKRHFENKFGEGKVMLLPCFYNDSPPERLPGSGDYVLYQGNLGVPENEMSAVRICREIAPRMGEVKFIIAGANPSPRLKKLADLAANVMLMANLPDDKFAEVLNEARVHLLITEQATGIKLKLLNALCRGAHIVANSKMMKHTGLGEYVTIADSTEDICSAIAKKMKEPFIENRRLPPIYDNIHNIGMLESCIDERRQIATQ